MNKNKKSHQMKHAFTRSKGFFSHFSLYLLQLFFIYSKIISYWDPIKGSWGSTDHRLLLQLGHTVIA